MTNPQEPGPDLSKGDSSGWARPGSEEPRQQPDQNPDATTNIGHHEPPVVDYPADPQSTSYPPPPPPQYGGPAPYATPQNDAPPPPQPPRESKGVVGAILAVVTSTAALAIITVVSLVIAGVIGAEIYARHRADTVVAGVIKCIVEDDASVSFGPRPFLWQHFTKSYNDLSITTAGNNVRDAKGMKLQLQLDDINLTDGGDTRGTIGSLEATVTWTADGIKQSLQGLPLVGGFISGVTTNPDQGTVDLNVEVVIFSGTIRTKPQVVDNQLKLEVVSIDASGFPLPSESIQPVLDEYTQSLTADYPMDIQAEAIEVTDDGVLTRFGARNATIPRSGDNPCFQDL